VASPKSEKPADDRASNRLRKSAHFGKRRGSSASTKGPFLQTSAPILLGSIALCVLRRFAEGRI
jgi:hypothetical protein